jgi:adenylate cyclase
MPLVWPFIEIERRFLVRSDAWREEVNASNLIRQSYFTVPAGLTARVRWMEDVAVLTCKTATVGTSRGEWEIPILPAAAHWLLTLCPKPPIEKIRHLVPVAEGRVWEIDVFLGPLAGLVIAEIELIHPLQDFIRPHWLGEEITSDRRFRNSQLYRAQRPPA